MAHVQHCAKPCILLLLQCLQRDKGCVFTKLTVAVVEIHPNTSMV